MEVDGAHFEALIADLEAAVRELTARTERDPALWSRARPGKWSAGQHTEHVTVAMELSAERFDESLARRRARTLAPVPRRGPVQWLWVAIVKRTMPRGGRAPAVAQPGAAPERAAVTARLTGAVDRHRAAGAALAPGERDRLWIPNPFMPRWHYTLPEMVRVHAVHARHHAKLIGEIG